MVKLVRYTLCTLLMLSWSALLCSKSVKAQNFQVGDTMQVLLKAVEKSPKNKPVQFVIKPARQLNEAESGQYNGIPASLAHYGVFVFDFQPAQHAYEKYLSGQLPKERVPLIKEYYDVDTSDLSKLPVQQGLAVLSAIKGNKKLIIYDTNHDKDFSNDPVSEFSLDSVGRYERRLDLLQTIEVPYQYYAGKKIHDRVSRVKVLPYHSSYVYGPEDAVEQKLQVYIVSYLQNEGSLSIEDKNYKVLMHNGQFLGGDYRRAEVMIWESDKAFVEVEPTLKIGNTFTMDGTRVKFQSASEFGDTLTLVRLDTSNANGYRVGETMHAFYFTDIVSGETVSSQGLKEYILLDFWGVWCAPCIEGLPKLKALYEANKNKMDLISIAYDDDVDKVRNFVNKRGLMWKHKFENMKALETDDLVKRLEVDCYPTFMLLNANNEIVYRGCGEEALVQVEKIVGK